MERKLPYPLEAAWKEHKHGGRAALKFHPLGQRFTF